MKTAISCSNSQVSIETQVTASPTRPLSPTSLILRCCRERNPISQQSNRGSSRGRRGRRFLRNQSTIVAISFPSQQNEEICSSFWNQWQMSISQKLGPNKRWAISTALFMEVTANKEENVLLF